MQSAHFTTIPSRATALGRGQNSFIYNDQKFTLQAFESREVVNTNQNAMRYMTNNIQANDRKRTMGVGMGQYLDPRELGSFNISHVELATTVKGNRFSIRIDVTENGEYKSKHGMRATDSMRKAATQLMDGIFKHVGMTDIFENGNQLTQVRRPERSGTSSGMRF